MSPFTQTLSWTLQKEQSSCGPSAQQLLLPRAPDWRRPNGLQCICTRGPGTDHQTESMSRRRTNCSCLLPWRKIKLSRCVLELLCYRNNCLCFPGTPWRKGTSPGTSTWSKVVLLTQPPGTPWLWRSIIALHLQPLNAVLIQACPSMQKINNIIYKGQKNNFHKSEPIFLMWDLYLN